MHAHTARLNKTVVGEYLGREKEYQKGFCVKVLHEYVDSMDFSGLDFDVAIRHFLAGFRLPGEAQKIDRMLRRQIRQIPSGLESGRRRASRRGLFPRVFWKALECVGTRIVSSDPDAGNSRLESYSSREGNARIDTVVGGRHDGEVRRALLLAEQERLSERGRSLRARLLSHHAADRPARPSVFSLQILRGLFDAEWVGDWCWARGRSRELERDARAVSRLLRNTLRRPEIGHWKRDRDTRDHGRRHNPAIKEEKLHDSVPTTVCILALVFSRVSRRRVSGLERTIESSLGSLRRHVDESRWNAPSFPNRPLETTSRTKTQIAPA